MSYLDDDVLEVLHVADALVSLLVALQTPDLVLQDLGLLCQSHALRLRLVQQLHVRQEWPIIDSNIPSYTFWYMYMKYKKARVSIIGNCIVLHFTLLR